MSDEHRIRPFESIEEYRECVALQEDTWGRDFSERVSPAILKVSQILGGVAAGAYDPGGILTGFVFGLTGVRDGETVHWSDMLAVRPGLRDRGLGTRLKAYQREQVMRRGIDKMFWTFDPLQSRNAYLNFNHLGIVVREYVENMYGATDSPLHRGIGTDRFVALWLLGSERVVERLSAALDAGAARPARTVEPGDVPLALDADVEDPHPRPREPVLTWGNDLVAVKIPSDIGSLMDADMGLALEWRVATRMAFTHYLTARYEVCELVRGERTSTYVLANRSA